MATVGTPAIGVETEMALMPGMARPVRGQVMDRLREFLEVLKEQGPARGNFLGLLNVLIGRRIQLDDGTDVSRGMSWRDAAAMLKKVRWDPQSVSEVGQDPATLPPRDRQRYWYLTISQAGVDSPEATAAGDRLAEAVRAAGYNIGPAPGA